MPSTPPTQDEWIERLKPHLTRSLDDVSEEITSHPSIQSWLHRAPFEAAQPLGGMADLQARAHAHGRMQEDLKAQFPELVDAVRTLTQGCGHLDLHWRPLEPNYSRVYIDFRRGFDVALCYPLDTLAARAIQRALQAVEAALPAGTPFPNRPNTATGLVVHEGHGLGVRYTDRIGENDQRWRRVTLLPPDREPLKNLRPPEAPQAVRRYFETVTESD